jgi:hypothetical protein
MRTWDDQTITVKDVNYDEAIEAIRQADRKYNLKHVAVWDDLIWRCWEETGLDHRAADELEEQPDEVAAYKVGGKTLRSLGLMPCDAGLHVVFICHDAKWAVVASTSTLVELDDDQLDQDDDEEDNG